jgi:phosphoserine phosphatase
MRARPAILAVVFDFDETLVPDSTSKLLQSRGIDPADFWGRQVRSRLEQGFDPTLAYLGLVLENVGADRPLGCISNRELRAFGATLDENFYPGLPAMFDDLREVVAEYNDVSVEFHIISGGLLEVVLGSEVVAKQFTNVVGCEFAEDESTGCISAIKRAITFTEKTRYLFEINKGIERADTVKNPYLVNRDVPAAQRPVPFENMIYVGDGLTDIPCFSLLKKERGASFGVFDPKRRESARKAYTEFLQTDRVISMHAPKYGPDDELGSLLRTAIATRASAITLQRAQAEV